MGRNANDPRNRLAYTITSIKCEDGRHVPHVRVQCGKCPERLLIRIKGPNNPEMVGQWVARRGWRFDPFTVASPRCPACQNVKPRKELPMSKASNVTSIDVSRPLTPDDRDRIRRLLEGTFDAAKGIYLMEYSDQRIGMELKVPWASVREIREIGYGPIKAVPELDAVLADLATLRDRANDLATQTAKLQTDITASESKLRDVTRKLGVAT